MGLVDTVTVRKGHPIMENDFEAIPKADYENRLKADMVAMLTEIQLEIEACVDGGEGSLQFEQGVTIARLQVVEMIQQKINALQESEDNK